MRRFLILCAALLLGGMSAVQEPSDQFAQLMTMGVTGGSDLGGFVGVLDSQPATAGAYSLRRVLTSYTANKAIHVTCAGGTSSSGDVGFAGPNFDFDTTGYNNHLGTGSCAVDTWYDQSGAGNNIVQATGANQPTVTLNAFNGRAVITFGATLALADATFPSTAEPFTGAVVVIRTAAFTTQQNIYTDNSNQNMIFATSANTVSQVGAFTATANDSVLHSIQLVYNGASSAWFIDGTKTTGNAGAGGITSGTLNVSTTAGGLQGQIGELFIFKSALADASNNALRANQKTYFGTP